MKFPEMLIEAIRSSEIPLRFEPGAEEAVARPVSDMLRAWLAAHRPEETLGESSRARDALIGELAAELDGVIDVPSA